MLVGAAQHWRQGLLASCFYEWREMGELKVDLYKKVGVWVLG